MLVILFYLYMMHLFNLIFLISFLLGAGFLEIIVINEEILLMLCFIANQRNGTFILPLLLSSQRTFTILTHGILLYNCPFG